MMTNTQNAHKPLDSATGSVEQEFLRILAGSHRGCIQGEHSTAGQEESLRQDIIQELQQMAAQREQPIEFLTADLHVLPYFAGNRSPRADPTLTSTLVGLTSPLDHTAACTLYLALLQSFALGLRHTLDELQRQADIFIDQLVLSGG